MLIDVWRCLEVCFAANIGPEAFNGPDAHTAAARVGELFADRAGPGMRALLDEQRLGPKAAEALFTRITALVKRVIG